MAKYVSSTGGDPEKQNITVNDKLDIEHALVEDDPRIWTSGRKAVVLFIVSAATMIAGLAANIQNPANQDIEDKLHASPSEISWSLSLYILVQGNFPLLWTAISEIKGRKVVYIVSFIIFLVGSIIIALAKTIGVVIGMRALQAAGSSAVMAIGAGTLADIYDPVERGTKIGLYYSAPLLGPSLGPLIGGALTQRFGWRSVFWFLTILAAITCISFLVFLKDTFRRERSLTYQNVLRRRTKRRAASIENALRVEDTTVVDHTQSTVTPEAASFDQFKLSITDVNPFPPLLLILRRWNNIAILFSSGLLFAITYSITYTCARTMSNKYHYNALKTGLVLLSFGIGSLAGSILGGRWSDRTLARLKSQNGSKSYPEMRLESSKLAMWGLPPSVVGYAWVCEKHVHISAVCVMLFLVGFFSVWIYASNLAYVVDANLGRSSIAVATNSSFRGISAFIAAEVAIPLQDAIGDGGLYTIWAGLMIIAELLILLVLYKGGHWREKAEKREAHNNNK